MGSCKMCEMTHKTIVIDFVIFLELFYIISANFVGFLKRTGPIADLSSVCAES